MCNFQVLELGSKGSELVIAEALSRAKAVQIQQRLTKSVRVVNEWLKECGAKPSTTLPRYVVEEVTL